MESRWFTFHEDLADELQQYFDEGGTVNNLKDKQNFSHCSNTGLGHCIDEHAVECFPIMLANMTQQPTRKEWYAAIRSSRDDFIKQFMEHGYFPPYSMLLNLPQEEGSVLYTFSTFFCKKATLTCLLIGEILRQPFSSIWKLIAHCVWNTRKDRNWIRCVPL